MLTIGAKNEFLIFFYQFETRRRQTDRQTDWEQTKPRLAIARSNRFRLADSRYKNGKIFELFTNFKTKGHEFSLYALKSPLFSFFGQNFTKIMHYEV